MSTYPKSAAILEKARQNSGFKVLQLAELCGITTPGMAQILRGAYRPKPDVLATLVDRLPLSDQDREELYIEYTKPLSSLIYDFAYATRVTR